jgi:hypothetical protein
MRTEISSDIMLFSKSFKYLGNQSINMNNEQFGALAPLVIVWLFLAILFGPMTAFLILLLLGLVSALS